MTVDPMFPKGIKRALAMRVAYRCSNPDCQRVTVGPGKTSGATLVIGEAAHICGALPGSARYDSKMTNDDRKGFENGIWLCPSCHTMIDKDPCSFPVDLLKNWKKAAEESAARSLASFPMEAQLANDSDLCDDKRYLQFAIRCFSRPAFEDDIWFESSMDDFDAALNSTVRALDTGELIDRGGNLIEKVSYVRNLHNAEWHKQFNEVYKLLMQMRRRSNELRESGKYVKLTTQDGETYGFDLTGSPEENNEARKEMQYFNDTRRKMLQLFSEILESAGFSRMEFMEMSY